MSKKPDPRGKLESECSADERKLIAEWFALSHPTNHPKDRTSARWTFCTRYGAKLHVGFL